MSKFMKVAVAQYAVPLAPEAATAKLSDIAQKAASEDVSLLVAPETALGSLTNVKQAAKDYLSDLQYIAQQREISIATSFYITEDGQFFNQGYVVSASGEIIHSHRKIYLARPEQEADGISAGSGLTVGDSPVGKVGMLICKDGFTRYSHFLYEKLNELGAQIVTIPSWSIGWEEHNTQEYIKTLYTYGAFASRAYVLVAGNLNQDTHSFGRSLIISPIRGVLQEGPQDKEEILIERIDLDEVHQARELDDWWQPKERLY